QLPPEGDAVARVSPAHRADAVARAGTLDLHHVSTEVGEVPSAAWAGDHRRRVHHPKPGERRRSVSHGSPACRPEPPRFQPWRPTRGTNRTDPRPSRCTLPVLSRRIRISV